MAQKSVKWLLLLAVLTALPSLAAPSTNYTILRSFGYVDQAGMDPDILIEGEEGVLYGSAWIGSSFLWNASADNPARGLVFRMQKDGSGYLILHRFTETNQMVTDLVYGTNGVLYGTTYTGGSFERGTIFKLNTDGSGFVVLHEFAGGSDGEDPRGLILASDGMLYGTTRVGGTSNGGTAFRINVDGSEYAIIQNFSQGKNPKAGVIEGSDGLLYGSTSQGGGAANAGTVFKLNKDGSGYAIVATFAATNGASPAAALLEGSDGALYGSTEAGGNFNVGTTFKVNRDGSAYQVLHHFAGGADGSTPSARLLEGTDGAMYGSTKQGDPAGTLFRVSKDGDGYQVIRTNIWYARMMRSSDGALYGARLSEVFRVANDGSDYQMIKAFTSSGGDGTGPYILIEGTDGLLYGMTIWGGKDDLGAGTVFKLGKDGSGYTVLRYFTNEPAGAARPRALLEGSDGLLYGALDAGGAFGVGMLFTLKKDGSDFNVIVDFDRTNGAGHAEGLIEGSDGALYGNTKFGGGGFGTAYRVNKDGSGYTVLHTFTGYGDGDGAHPEHGLMEGTDGWLYGVSQLFGSASKGMIFKLRKDGTDYNELYNFADLGSSLSGPCAKLIEGSGGALYGVTQRGGDVDAGILFRINKDGTSYTRLLSFQPGYFNEGKKVMQGSDGVLYGVTFTSGAVDQGTLFRINTDGTRHSVVHDFTNTSGDGGGPWGTMIEGSDGALYGTTSWGGAMNVGTVFRYVPSPEVMSVERQAGGAVRVTARGLSGNVLAIEASMDLVTWSEVGSGLVVNGRFAAGDLGAGGFGHRFYRAVVR